MSTVVGSHGEPNFGQNRLRRNIAIASVNIDTVFFSDFKYKILKDYISLHFFLFADIWTERYFKINLGL